MRFPHKHPSIYETGRGGRGGFRRPSWIVGWQASTYIQSQLIWAQLASLKVAAFGQQLLCAFFSPRRRAWHGAAGGPSLGPKNCVNIWISLSLKVQRCSGDRTDSPPTKTEAISAQVQHGTRRQIFPSKTRNSLNFWQNVDFHWCLVLLTSPYKIQKVVSWDTALSTVSSHLC